MLGSVLIDFASFRQVCHFQAKCINGPFRNTNRSGKPYRWGIPAVYLCRTLIPLVGFCRFFGLIAPLANGIIPNLRRHRSTAVSPNTCFTHVRHDFDADRKVRAWLAENSMQKTTNTFNPRQNQILSLFERLQDSHNS